MAAAWRRHARETRDRFRVPVLKQTLDLCALALLHGIPPQFYYAYGLYLKPRHRWFHFIYEHELPHWHAVVCGKRDISPAVRLLSDKKAFSEAMARVSIPTIETLAVIRRGEPIDAGKLFTGRSLFCKPNTGSGCAGVFELLFDPDSRQYRLAGENDVEGEEAILRHFSKLTADRDYILQPLLVNHPEIHRMCGRERLATIRIVSAHGGRKAVCVGAVFEMPRPDDRNLWWLMPVDPQTGRLMEPVETFLLLRKADEAPAPDIAGRTLPCWNEAVQMCLRAHEMVAEVAAVGWDVAVTPSGAVLIEGNFNWRVTPLQALTGIPSLETEIAGVYASRLWPEQGSPSGAPTG